MKADKRMIIDPEIFSLERVMNIVMVYLHGCLHYN